MGLYVYDGPDDRVYPFVSVGGDTVPVTVHPGDVVEMDEVPDGNWSPAKGKNVAATVGPDNAPPLGEVAQQPAVDDVPLSPPPADPPAPVPPSDVPAS